MPVMKPSTSLLNFTPSSYSPESAALALAGTADEFHRLVHGHSPTMIETVMPDPTDSTLPLSSVALVLMVAVPTMPGVHSIVHDDVPVAFFHVVPPSTDTSTPPTVPPPLSTAVPLIVVRLPLSTEPLCVGDVTVEVGAKMSADCVLVTSGRVGSAPACNVD